MMRILHTADWHLGAQLHRYSREAEHQQFLTWLEGVIQKHEVDALLVSGDLYDHGNPPAVAQELLFQFLVRVKQQTPSLDIILTAGNHDSPGRLSALSPLLKALGVHMIGVIPQDPSSLAIPLTDRDGNVACWCAALPFLRPMDVPDFHQYEKGAADLYEQVVAACRTKREKGQALLAMGHLYAIGGTPSEESERRLFVGHEEALPCSIFPEDLAYVALGHLHRPQSVGTGRDIRYSGSPIPLAIDEANYPHQVLLVEVTEETVHSISPIHVPRFRDCIRLPAKGTITAEKLEETLSQLPERDDREPAYLAIHLSLSAPDPHLRHRVDELLKEKAVQLCQLSIRYEGQEEALADTEESSLLQLDPETVFQRYYTQVYGGEAPEPLMQGFRELQALAAAEELE